MSFIPLFEPQGFNIYSKGNERNSPEHVKLTNRLRKTLYYGKTPTTERPSLPLTEIAVEFFQDASPKEFGRLDTDYASFVSRRSCMSPCSMMLGMIYIERLKHKNPEYLQTISSSDLFLISLMVASKYLYDEGVDEEVFNDEWAESAKMENEDLNGLERNFLGAIDWNLFARPNDFADVLRKIEKRIALNQSVDRGWFTYTDLVVLMEDLNYMDDAYNLARELSKMVLVCAVAYTASLLTLVGSTVLVTCWHNHVAAMGINTADTNSNTELQTPDLLPASRPLPVGPLMVTIDDVDVLIGHDAIDSNQKAGFRDFIPSLQLVITLTDSVTDFFAALLNNGNMDDDYGHVAHHIRTDTGQQHTHKSGKYCKRGLCLHETGLNCRNVTSGTWKTRIHNLLDSFSRNRLGAGRCVSDGEWTDVLDDAGFGAKRPFGSHQRCCCDMADELRMNPHRSSFKNVMVGVRTGVPIL